MEKEPKKPNPAQPLIATAGAIANMLTEVEAADKHGQRHAGGFYVPVSNLIKANGKPDMKLAGFMVPLATGRQLRACLEQLAKAGLVQIRKVPEVPNEGGRN